MGRILGAHLLFLAVAALSAADAPGIRIPSGPVIPAPMPPAPPPSEVLTLTPDLLYVIDSDQPIIVLASPDGLVKFVGEESPVRIRGRFIDDPLKAQTRTFKGKQVYTVEPLKSGRVELLIIPVGENVVLPHDVVRRTIVVDMGEGPRPPPDGVLGLIKASRDGAAKIPAGIRASGAKSLAKAQRGIASAIAAGGLSKPADILAEWRAANNAAASGADWKPWGEVVSGHLGSLYAAGRLPDGKAWAAAFAEIAEGLEQ